MLGLRVPGLRSLAESFARRAYSTPKPISKGQEAIFQPLPKKRNGENVLTFLHKQLVEKHDPTGKRSALVAPDGLRAGDVIRITYTDRTSVLGQLIGIKRGNHNIGTNLHIRNKMNRIGVEMRVPLFSPNIKNIERVSLPKKYPSRKKHYYIRNNRLDVGDLENAPKHKSS